MLKIVREKSQEEDGVVDMSCDHLAKRQMRNQILKMSFYDLEDEFEEEEESINRQMQEKQCDLEKDLKEKSIVRKNFPEITSH